MVFFIPSSSSDIVFICIFIIPLANIKINMPSLVQKDRGTSNPGTTTVVPGFT